VWALLSVEAGVGKAETLDGAAMEKMFGDDLVDVADVYGLVGSNVVPEAGFLDGVLEGGFEFFAARVEAAGTGGAFVAFVGADEDVMVEFRHCVPFPVSRYTVHRAF
jgi:hypothetical protein